ncbi:MAG: hypothetical protein ABSH34_24630 [Verrucomicrobiota bacterium]|jgi:hypothetical protein
MKPPNVYWHVYPRTQIKPTLRGNLIYVLEVPVAAGSPVIRDIIDPSERDFPCHHTTWFPTPGQSQRRGIVFSGVSKAAVYDVMLFDPRISNDDVGLTRYNAGIVVNARSFFLIAPEHDLRVMPALAAQLLCGLPGVAA